jgi:UDP-N-acetylglucosamine:LPS N-acetylglucosamine transferase
MTQAEPRIVGRQAARVVIVSGSVGAGHDGVAHELARRLRHRGFNVTVEDQLQGFSPLARFTLGAGYLLILRAAPRLYDLTCWLVERSGAVQRIADQVCRTSTKWLLDVTSEADLVLATYPPACRALGHLRSIGQLQIPVVAYLTDPAPNFLWVHPCVDLHLTAAEYTAEEVGERYGVAAVAAGPLVAPLFRMMSRPRARAVARRDVRTELGLAPDDLVALLLLGSLGIGGVRRAARVLSAAGIRPVVLCARNQRLRRRLARVPGAIALGWRDDVASLIAASDVVIHNAGGLSLTESLVIGVPALTYAPVAGHGKANARSLERGGMAPWVRSSKELATGVFAQASATRAAWPRGQETVVERLCTILSELEGHTNCGVCNNVSWR